VNSVRPVEFWNRLDSADRPPLRGRPLNERIDTADEECIDCGYEPELQRTLGSFQIFAISFAFISVAVGIFATYDSVLATAGPVGIWLWVFAAVGQTLVALVVAQFAARIALSGSSYQWASRLANPKIGWLSAELAHLSHTPPDRWNGRAGDLPARLRIRLVDRLGDVHTVNL